jgi:hypothetical protein
MSNQGSITVDRDFISLLERFEVNKYRLVDYVSTVSEEQYGDWDFWVHHEWYTNYEMSMPPHGWQCAGFGHLVTFATKYPNEQLIKRIVAMGAEYESKQGIMQVPYLGMCYTGHGYAIRNSNVRAVNHLSKHNLYQLFVKRTV